MAAEMRRYSEFGVITLTPATMFGGVILFRVPESLCLRRVIPKDKPNSTG